jgi:hypothetical protein
MWLDGSLAAPVAVGDGELPASVCGWWLPGWLALSLFGLADVRAMGAP